MIPGNADFADINLRVYQRVCLSVNQTVKIAAYRAEYGFGADDNRRNGVKYIRERFAQGQYQFLQSAGKNWLFLTLGEGGVLHPV